MAVEINLPFMLYPASCLVLEVLFQFLDFFFCHKPRIHPAVTRTPSTYCYKGTTGILAPSAGKVGHRASCGPRKVLPIEEGKMFHSATVTYINLVPRLPY